MIKKLLKCFIITFIIFLIPFKNSHAAEYDIKPYVKVYTDLPWEEYIIPQYNALSSYYIRRSYNGKIYEGWVYRTNITNEYGHYLYKGVLTLGS